MAQFVNKKFDANFSFLIDLIISEQLFPGCSVFHSRCSKTAQVRVRICVFEPSLLLIAECLPFGGLRVVLADQNVLWRIDCASTSSEITPTQSPCCVRQGARIASR